MGKLRQAGRMRVGFSRVWASAVLAAALGLCAPLGAAEIQPPQDPPAKGDEPPLRAPADWAYAIHFDRDVTVELKQATIAQACRSVAEQTNVPIFLDPALAKNDLRITLPKSTMPATEAVRRIGRFALASVSFIGDGIVLTSRGSPAIPITRIYVIRTILYAEYPHSVLPADLGQLDRLLAEAHSYAARRIGFVAYLQAAVAPGTWRRSDVRPEGVSWPPYAIHGFDGRLAVTQTAAAHKQVEDALNNFRRARSLQAFIQPRYIEADKASYQAVRPRLKFQRATGSGPKEKEAWTLSLAQLTDKESEGLLSELKRGHRSTILVAPLCTFFNTQRGRFDVFPQLSGDVRDYEPRGAVSPNAEKRVLNRLRISAQPFVWADRRKITLVLSFHEPRLGSGPTERMISTTLPDRGYLLFEGLSHFDRDPKQQKEGTVLLLLLRVAVVPDIFEEE